MEFQKRVLLLMNYNNSKTLNENTQSLLTESVVEPVTKILRNLVGLADNELSKVINKTKPELQTLLNSSRRTADQIDDLFKSIVNPKSLAQTLIDTKGLLNNKLMITKTIFLFMTNLPV
jgi:arsenate reductase-like glutaredoxin family protein